MADTKYTVEVEVKTTGDFEGKVPGMLDRAGKHADTFESKLGQIKGGFEKLASASATMMAPFDMVASKVFDLGVGMAKLGAAAGIGIATYAVTKLNNELEKTQISMAAIMNANDMSTGGIQGGMKMAGDQMVKMRKDAAALPGEFSDLANIMRTVMIPGSHAGLGADQLRELSAKTMAAGAVAGLPMDMVAREMAQLMEGRAGAHNVLGMRLMGLSGDSAEKFNKSAAPKRAEMISEALDKFAPSVEVFKESYEGLSSTFLDNVKQFIGVATGPLFGRVKDTLKDVNGWFDKNGMTWRAWAEVVGEHFTAAFDFARSSIEKWGPTVFDFANNAYSKIVEVWRQIEPVVERIGAKVAAFMSDPQAWDKIERVAKLYAELKVAQMAISPVGSVVTGGMSVAGSLTQMGAFGGAGAGAAAAGGGAGAAAGGSALAAGGVAAGAALVGVVGAMHAVEDESSLFHGIVVENWSTLKQSWSVLTADMATAGMGLIGALTPLAEVLGVAVVGAANVAVLALEGLMGPLAALAKLMGWVTPSGLRPNDGPYSASDKAEFDKGYGDTRTLAEKAAAREQMDIIAQGLEPKGGSLLDKINASVTQEKKQGHGSGKHPGGGGTNIARVEIVVTSNSEPSRIARMVLSEIQNIQRHPKVSRDVPNYSAP